MMLLVLACVFTCPSHSELEELLMGAVGASGGSGLWERDNLGWKPREHERRLGLKVALPFLGAMVNT